MDTISSAVGVGVLGVILKRIERDSLLRGKNEEQQAVINFFYGLGGGCMAPEGGCMTVEEYDQKVHEKLNRMNTKQMALKKLGLDEEEVQEIAPVIFGGYVFNNKAKNLVVRTSDNIWISSDYMVTWLFFGEHEVFVYQYSFSMISDEKKGKYYAILLSGYYQFYHSF